MIITKKTIIFQGFRGGLTFSSGVGVGGGGVGGGGGGSNVQMLISFETHITCDFPGGGGGGGYPPSGTAHESDVSPLRVLLFHLKWELTPKKSTIWGHYRYNSSRNWNMLMLFKQNTTI